MKREYKKTGAIFVGFPGGPKTILIGDLEKFQKYSEKSWINADRKLNQGADYIQDKLARKDGVKPALKADIRRLRGAMSGGKTYDVVRELQKRGQPTKYIEKVAFSAGLRYIEQDAGWFLVQDKTAVSRNVPRGELTRRLKENNRSEGVSLIRVPKAVPFAEKRRTVIMKISPVVKEEYERREAENMNRAGEEISQGFLKRDVREVENSFKNGKKPHAIVEELKRSRYPASYITRVLNGAGYTYKETGESWTLYKGNKLIGRSDRNRFEYHR